MFELLVGLVPSLGGPLFPRLAQVIISMNWIRVHGRQTCNQFFGAAPESVLIRQDPCEVDALGLVLWGELPFVHDWYYDWDWGAPSKGEEWGSPSQWIYDNDPGTNDRWGGELSTCSSQVVGDGGGGWNDSWFGSDRRSSEIYDTVQSDRMKLTSSGSVVKD